MSSTLCLYPGSVVRIAFWQKKSRILVLTTGRIYVRLSSQLSALRNEHYGNVGPFGGLRRDVGATLSVPCDLLLSQSVKNRIRQSSALFVQLQFVCTLVNNSYLAASPLQNNFVFVGCYQSQLIYSGY